MQFLFAVSFILQTLYFNVVQYMERSKQVKMVGGSPGFQIFIVSAIHIIAGWKVFFGKNGSERKNAAVALALITVISSAVNKFNIAASMGVHHQPAEARAHDLFLQFELVLGCLLLYSVADLSYTWYEKQD